MERRFSPRAQVDIPIRALVDGISHPCRAVDLSASGLVLERAKSLLHRDLSAICPFELRLGDRLIRTRARSIWNRDRFLAIRFVVMNDADRLTIAEHLDRMVRLREPLH